MRYSLRGRSAGAPRPRGGPGVRGLLGALVGALLLTGCSTGTDAVDVNNGGGFRFVPGTPAGEGIPPDERAPAPDFSGPLPRSEERRVGEEWRSWWAPYH